MIEMMSSDLAPLSTFGSTHLKDQSSDMLVDQATKIEATFSAEENLREISITEEEPAKSNFNY